MFFKLHIVRAALGLFTAILLCSSCAALTESQLQTVQKLAVSGDSVAAAPSAMFRQLAAVRTERGLFYAASLTGAQARFAELVDTIGRDALPDLIDSVIAAVTERVTDVALHRHAADVRDLHGPAHQLISLFGNFALTRLHDLSRRLASACLAGNRSDVEHLVGELEAQTAADLPLLSQAAQEVAAA